MTGTAGPERPGQKQPLVEKVFVKISVREKRGKTLVCHANVCSEQTEQGSLFCGASGGAMQRGVCGTQGSEMEEALGPGLSPAAVTAQKLPLKKAGKRIPARSVCNRKEQPFSHDFGKPKSKNNAVLRKLEQNSLLAPGLRYCLVTSSPSAPHREFSQE